MKPQLTEAPPFYHGYINAVTENEAVNGYENAARDLIALLKTFAVEKWNFSYAAGKWTIKQLVQHLIDTDRIMGYRALAVARGEAQSLPGFDENEYAANATAEHRNPKKIIAELELLTKSTLALLQSFTEADLKKTGSANNNAITVHALCFILAGHLRHHTTVIQERYLQ